MKYNSALRPYIMKRLEAIEKADIVIGIPCYNNERTIEHVIRMVSYGLHDYYRDLRPVIIVSDGGSTDDTRDVAKEFQLKPWQEKIVSIYRGAAGKGTALRMIFEAAGILGAQACMVVDSDLRSITDKWVKLLLAPIIGGEYEFVAPIYTRYKYDGTITNNIVYNLCQAVYGKSIRQPIGGDFAFGKNLVHFLLDQDVWATDVARFGIDIWMTVQAITHDFRICQAHLGRKIHDAKDPSKHLGPMFRQVVSTLFELMEETEDQWQTISGAEPTPTFGEPNPEEPEAIEVNYQKLVSSFKNGVEHFGALWKEIFCPESFCAIRDAASMADEVFRLPIETWVRILYEIAATYHQWPANQRRLVDLMTPLYYGRVASFINETREMDSFQAERLVQEHANFFVKEKNYLINNWNTPRQCSVTFMQEIDRF